jgi:hypothetical protein
VYVVEELRKRARERELIATGLYREINGAG